MSEVRSSQPEICELSDLLVSATQALEVDMQRAGYLESQATALRDSAPKKYDQAVHQATTRLFKLAESGLEGRELLEGVLYVNQYKPSRVSWSGPADIEGTLSAFDLLKQDTPLITSASYYGSRFAGVITDSPVEVGVALAQGMGGLPEAHITYGIRTRDWLSPDKAALSDEETIITQSHGLLLKSVIGSVALQKMVDSQRLTRDTTICGHGETNREKLESLKQTTDWLISVTGLTLDMSNLDGQLRMAEEKADEDKLFALRMSSRSRRAIRY